MSFKELEHILQAQTSKSVHLESDDEGRMYIVPPFAFGDGDEPVIAPRKNGSGWMFSDEGSTMMRLSCRLSDSERQDPECQRKIDGAMAIGGVRVQDGELYRLVEDSNYSEALFDFLHALLRIDELGYPNRRQSATELGYGRSVSASMAHSGDSRYGNSRSGMSVRDFRKAFTNLIMEVLPEERISFGWNDPSWDWNGEYTVDCRVNGMSSPLFLHALGTNTHARDATITIYRFQEQDVWGRHIAIFRDANRLTKRVRAKLDTVCETRFDSFLEERLRIKEFLLDESRR